MGQYYWCNDAFETGDVNNRPIEKTSLRQQKICTFFGDSRREVLLQKFNAHAQTNAVGPTPKAFVAGCGAQHARWQGQGHCPIPIAARWNFTLGALVALARNACTRVRPVPSRHWREIASIFCSQTPSRLSLSLGHNSWPPLH
ncbi:MAG: hypothetical protein V4857_18445 [Pseudomonadota bacterium]